MGRRINPKNLKTSHNNPLAEGGKDPKDVRKLQTSSPNKYTLQNFQKDDKQETGLIPGKVE